MPRPIPRPKRNRRTFEPRQDDPGRKPYRVIDLYRLRDRMIVAHGSKPDVHEGRLLLQASVFRAFDRGHPQDGDMIVGRSYWGHSAKSALGFCLRVCNGYDDWPVDRFEAIPYDEWVEQINKKELDHPMLWDLPATRRAANPVEPAPVPSYSEPGKKPVDPLAPTDPAPPRSPDEEVTRRIRTPPPPAEKPGPTRRARSRRVSETQLALDL